MPSPSPKLFRVAESSLKSPATNGTVQSISPAVHETYRPNRYQPTRIFCISLQFTEDVRAPGNMSTVQMPYGPAVHFSLSGHRLRRTLRCLLFHPGSYERNRPKLHIRIMITTSSNLRASDHRARSESPTSHQSAAPRPGTPGVLRIAQHHSKMKFRSIER